MKILLVQGANLIFLGRRELAIYGTTTAAELDAVALYSQATALGPPAPPALAKFWVACPGSAPAGLLPAQNHSRAGPRADRTPGAADERVRARRAAGAGPGRGDR